MPDSRSFGMTQNYYYQVFDLFFPLRAKNQLFLCCLDVKTEVKQKILSCVLGVGTMTVV